MDEEENDEELGYTSRKFHALDIVVLGLSLAHGITQAIARDLATATHLVAAHTNYKIDRENFLEEAALEIETMTGEDDG